jgi:DNA-directed RNA polymerase specialized sigma24 family protein
MNENAQIEAKLDTLIKLFALAVAPETLSLKERALRLQRAGLAPKEIAALCDTTPNTVSVALSAARRAGRKTAK